MTGVAKERDGSPLVVGEFIAHDSKLRFGGLNHALPAGLNIACVANLKGLSVAFHPKAEVLCSP